MRAQPTFDRYLTRSEERLLFSTVAKMDDLLAKRDHAWMRIMRESGGRVSSIAALNVFDARDGLATGRLAFHCVKGERPYDVHINLRLRRALHDVLRIRKKMGYPEDLDAALILTRRGQRMSIRSYQDRLSHWRQAAGFSLAVTPHWFRHTLAHRVLESSEAADPLGVVQKVLGHSSRNSAAIYTRPTREQVAQAMEAQR